MNNMSKQLIRNIILEYVIPVCAIILVRLAAFLIANKSGQKGIDGIGNALGIVLIMRILIAVIALIFLIINPIRILVTYRQELAGIVPTLRRVLSIVLIGVPILVSLPVILEVPISNFLYNRKYATGKGAYKAVEANYKLPRDFRDELISRGLYLTDEAETQRRELNNKFAGYIPDKFDEYYYAKATMMPIGDDTFYDTPNNKEILDPDSAEKRYPAYIYNAVLLAKDKHDSLSYVPFARYNDTGWLSGKDYPFFEDYYIECKILYVDGDLYAVIGVSESYDVEKSFETFDRPFYVILAEKENITTFVDGKYYPYGAIGNEGWRFEMHPNTTEHPYTSYTPANYPVRKVDRVDAETVNKVAAELQNGILSENARMHFEKSADPGKEGAKVSEYVFNAVGTGNTPVEGVIINVCTDDKCMPLTTGPDGKAVFTGDPAKYHIEIVRTPKKWQVAGESEFDAGEGSQTFTIELAEKAE